MKDEDLCKWLRDNSSGTYRPSAEAADRIETLSNALLETFEQVYDNPAIDALIERTFSDT